MTHKIHSHPGYLYQLTRQGNDDQSTLLKAEGFKPVEQTLHVYLTPSATSDCVNPLHNSRLRCVMNEVEVIAFDTPPEKEEANPVDYLCKLLSKKYNHETLVRINKALSESLKSKQPLITSIDEKLGDDSKKLVMGIALKIQMLKPKNLDVSPSSSNSNANAPKTVNPKHQIHSKAEETKKIIEYIDPRNFMERHDALLFDSGLLESLICLLLPDEALMQDLLTTHKNEEESWNACTLSKADVSKFEKHPTIIDLQQKLDHDFDEQFLLAEKINVYLSSKRKTLLVIEQSPETFLDTTRFISVFSGGLSEKLQIKGPIKESIGCFWEIKDKGVVVGHLLGSIHLAPTYLIDLNTRIRECFKECTRLAVEIDITRKDVATASLEAKKRWVATLSHLPPTQIDNIVEVLKKIFPDEADKTNLKDDRERPTFIFHGISKLKSMIFTEMGISSGIDVQLIRQAKSEGKPVEDLETQAQYEQQEATKASMATDPIKDLILQSLSLPELKQCGEASLIMKIIITQLSLQFKESLMPLFDAWEEGNLEKFDHSKEDPIDKKMVMTQRNMNMAMKIVKLVNTKEKLFCCVGAAHTVGEMNVQAFLKNFGLSTERVFV